MSYHVGGFWLNRLAAASRKTRSDDRNSRNRSKKGKSVESNELLSSCESLDDNASINTTTSHLLFRSRWSGVLLLTLRSKFSMSCGFAAARQDAARSHSPNSIYRNEQHYKTVVDRAHRSTLVSLNDGQQKYKSHELPVNESIMIEMQDTLKVLAGGEYVSSRCSRTGLDPPPKFTSKKTKGMKMAIVQQPASPSPTPNNSLLPDKLSEGDGGLEVEASARDRGTADQMGYSQPCDGQMSNKGEANVENYCDDAEQVDISQLSIETNASTTNDRLIEVDEDEQQIYRERIEDSILSSLKGLDTISCVSTVARLGPTSGDSIEDHNTVGMSSDGHGQDRFWSSDVSPVTSRSDDEDVGMGRNDEMKGLESYKASFVGVIHNTPVLIEGESEEVVGEHALLDETEEHNEVSDAPKPQTKDNAIDSPETIKLLPPAHSDSNWLQPLAATNLPLPWSSPKLVLKRQLPRCTTTKFIAEMETFLNRSLDIAVIKAASPKEKCLEEKDVSSEGFIDTVQIMSTQFEPLDRKTSMESVFALGYPKYANHRASDWSSYADWLNRNNDSKYWWKEMIVECILIHLLPEIDAKGMDWSAQLASYLIALPKGKEVERLQRLKSKEEKIRWAAAFTVGFHECCKQLCLLDGVPRNNVCMTRNLIEQCRSAALLRMFKEFYPKLEKVTSVFGMSQDEVNLEHKKKVKEDLLGVLQTNCQDTLTEKGSSLDHRLTQAINSIDKRWDDAKQMVALQLQRQLELDLKKKRDDMKEEWKKGRVGKTKCDQELVKLQGRCILALQHSVKKGLLSVDGFHAHMVLSMQLIKYASLEVQTILLLAGKDRRWESWDPSDFREYLQGFRALHQYWRKAKNSKMNSVEVEKVIIAKTKELYQMIIGHMKRVNELLLIAKRSRQQSIMMTVCRSMTLRFDRKSSISILRFIEARSNEMKEATRIPNDDASGINLLFMCVNIALALLWQGEQTENDVYSQVLEQIHGSLNDEHKTCSDCMIKKLCISHQNDLMEEVAGLAVACIRKRGGIGDIRSSLAKTIPIPDLPASEHRKVVSKRLKEHIIWKA